MFYWDDNVVDPNVSPLNGATPETFGVGTTLEAIDDYTIKWTFKEAVPDASTSTRWPTAPSAPARRTSSSRSTPSTTPTTPTTSTRTPSRRNT